MFLRHLPPPSSTLFPYTTLFRSPIRGRIGMGKAAADGAAVAHGAISDGLGDAGEDTRADIGCAAVGDRGMGDAGSESEDRKSTRLNSSHPSISYAVFCLKKKT